MQDLTAQPWYDSEATAVENTANMQAYLITNYDPLALSDIEKDTLVQFTIQLSMMVGEEAKEATDFYAARDADLSNVRSLYDVQIQARQTTWQALEATHDLGSAPAAVTAVNFV